MIFARKSNNKIPEFYTIFARKMPEIYIIIARKYFSRFGGWGTCPLFSTPMKRRKAPAHGAAVGRMLTCERTNQLIRPRTGICMDGHLGTLLITSSQPLMLLLAVVVYDLQT